jgi:HPt (histidine-containing phosphotransfer) domain-containing protein
LPILDGIDIEEALRRLDISFETLRPLLIRFRESQQQTVAELRAAVAARNSDAAGRHAHALSGAAGNLGANALREAAKRLEMAAKEGEAELGQLFADVDRQASIVFQSIESLPSRTQKAGRPSSGTPTDPAQLRGPLDLLQSALANFDHSGCVQVLTEIAKLQLSEEFHQDIIRLQELIDSYEYDKALEIANRLSAGLPEKGA